MNGPAVIGTPVASKVILVGQAPGDREIGIGKPFAWTAGKTLFGWFESIGLAESAFRSRVYMAAVCRCFPGKKPKGGDRVPNPSEVENCSVWLNNELDLLRPELVLPVGKLAIAQFMKVDKLKEVVGQRFRLWVGGRLTDVIPLPHPSGASTWHRAEPGRTLLGDSLRQVAGHPSWRTLVD